MEGPKNPSGENGKECLVKGNGSRESSGSFAEPFGTRCKGFDRKKKGGSGGLREAKKKSEKKRKKKGQCIISFREY